MMMVILYKRYTKDELDIGLGRDQWGSDNVLIVVLTLGLRLFVMGHFVFVLVSTWEIAMVTGVNDLVNDACKIVNIIDSKRVKILFFPVTSRAAKISQGLYITMFLSYEYLTGEQLRRDGQQPGSSKKKKNLET